VIIPTDLDLIAIFERLLTKNASSKDNELVNRHQEHLDSSDRFSGGKGDIDRLFAQEVTEEGLPYLLDDHTAYMEFENEHKGAYITANPIERLSEEIGTNFPIDELPQSVASLEAEVNGRIDDAGMLARYGSGSSEPYADVYVSPPDYDGRVDIKVDLYF